MYRYQSDSFVSLARHVPTRVLLLAVALAAGCVPIPPQEPQALPEAKQYGLDKNINAALASAAFQRGNWPEDAWWRTFGDAQLDRLMNQALEGNPDIRVAAARVRLAEQGAIAVRAGNFPQLGASGSILREKYSENWILPPEFAKTPYNEGQASLDAVYDFDLWDRNEELYRARLSQAQSAAADQAETRLVISAAVARSYFTLQGDLAREEISRAALAQRREFAQLVKLRANEGLENLAAVHQAQADVAREQANLLALQRAGDADRLEIVALLGKGPAEARTLTDPAVHAPATLGLPAILPLDLLARRPDVLATRWRVEAAAHAIGVAKAGFYPNIDLSASIGLQSLRLEDLLKRGSLFGTIGPAFHLPIFDGGRLRANLGAAYAEYDVAVEQYHRSLVAAAREVADRLAAVTSLGQQEQHQVQALRDSEEAYRIALLRYRNGISDYLSVLQVQRDLLRQRDATAQLETARQQATVGLIKALGGGYRANELPVARTAAQGT